MKTIDGTCPSSYEEGEGHKFSKQAEGAWQLKIKAVNIASTRYFQTSKILFKFAVENFMVHKTIDVMKKHISS